MKSPRYARETLIAGDFRQSRKGAMGLAVDAVGVLLMVTFGAAMTAVAIVVIPTLLASCMVFAALAAGFVTGLWMTGGLVAEDAFRNAKSQESARETLIAEGFPYGDRGLN